MPPCGVGEQLHSLRNNRTLFGREIFHDHNLHLCSLLFEVCDESAPVLAEEDSFLSTITLTLATENQSTPHQLIKHTTGGRFGATEHCGHVFDRHLTLAHEQKQSEKLKR
jgi:hypothetical protein